MPLRHRTVLTVAPALVLFTLLTAVVAVVAPQATSPAQAAGTPVMGRSVVSAADLAGWYRSTGKTSRATVGIDELATYYVDEGAAEGVAGGVAFP